MIRPERGWLGVDVGELWQYRDLIYFLARRDVAVRYKQTILGALWAILQPVMLMVVFTIIFGGLARMPSNGVPYPVFVFAGLVPWQLFAYALNEASTSVVNSERLITKVYFPRLAVPIAAIGAGVVDFAVSFTVLLALMAWFDVPLSERLVVVPLFVMLALVSALGVGLWLSAMNVKYRDVRYTLSFLTQFWFLATPVIYPSSIMPEPWRTVVGLNPMAGVVEGLRWAVVGGTAPDLPRLIVSAVAALLLLITGAFYFKRMERSFADVI